jgi:Tol biopolymer transport system component
MGEVYRARDTRLQRDVAIKILPEAFAGDPERLARFEREAQLLAALNHPHIAQIHGLEESNGVSALVMELVEGRTLADRIAAGPIPIDETLAIAAQIIDALETAHEQGIIHRDLKPANIKVRADGVVKVLDFGLAKAMSPAGIEGVASPGPSMSPTITSPAMTAAGLILGTAAYMAPEQAKGKAADKRADIWAFGVVLHEMLTGRGLFRADSIPETLAHVMTREVDLSSLPPGTPPRARSVIARCLVKDPRQRLRDIGDARLMLAEQDAPQAVPVAAARRSPFVIPALLVAAVAIAALALWKGPSSTAGSAAPDVTLSIVPPAAGGIAPAWSVTSGIRLSPDGSTLIYADTSGRYRIRELNSLAARLPDVDAGTTAFWSPDSRFIAFDVTSDIRKMRPPDGAPDTIVKTGGPVEGATWSEDGRILYALVRTSSALLEVSANGGEPTPVELAGLGPGSYFWPEFVSPAGDFLIGFEPQGADGMDVYLATLKDHRAINPVRLMKNDTAASFTSAGGGRVLFVRNDTLYAQRLDLKARALVGDPQVIVPGVATVPGFRLAEFSASRTGTIAWRPGGVGLSQLTIFDRSGAVVGTAGPPSQILGIRLSPDEQHVLLASQIGEVLVEPGRPGLLTVNKERSALTMAWSADGKTFLLPRPSRVMQLDVGAVSRGSEAPRELAAVPGLDRIEDVSADGHTILFTKGALATVLYAARLDGSPEQRAPQPVVQTGEGVFNARFSPDAKWIVYEAASAGISQEGQGIYVQPFPGPGLRRQISPRGQFPMWRKDGAEIVFYDDHRLRSIKVTGSGSDLHFADPVTLFTVRRPATVVDVTPLAVSRDGSRLFMSQPMEQPDSDVIHVRLNAIPGGTTQ